MWLLLFGLCFLIQAGYWTALHVGFARARRADAQAAGAEHVGQQHVGHEEAPLPPCSVVVAARDEEAALPDLLAALARQTHPRYEVIVVDDASTDATAETVRAHAEQHPHVRLVTVEQPQAPHGATSAMPRKKHALTCGIAAARHALLAFTDADCAPPPGWLEALAPRHAAAPEHVLLIGYSPLRRAPGLLCALARYETFVTGVYTAAAAGLGRAYMAVGRNISYPKALFDRIGGFAHSRRSMSGDDDLLVQHVVRTGAAHVHHVFGEATHVPTDAPATWRAWIRQKRRHASAGRFYAPPARRHLALFHTTGLALWLAPVALGWLGLALLAAKLAGQAWVLRRAAHVLGERSLLPGLPLWELLYAGYPLLIAPLGLARRPSRW